MDTKTKDTDLYIVSQDFSSDDFEIDKVKFSEICKIAFEAEAEGSLQFYNELKKDYGFSNYFNSCRKDPLLMANALKTAEDCSKEWSHREIYIYDSKEKAEFNVKRLNLELLRDRAEMVV